MIRRAPLFGLLVFCAWFTTACAFGTTPIRVAHSPFAGPPSPVRADLTVRVFRDLRETERLPYIGAKRNGYGMVLGHLGLPPGQKLDLLLTRYFAEALAQAGYRGAIEGDPESLAPEGFAPAAVVDGEIVNFWLDMYMANWHKVDVVIRLRDRSDAVLWEARFEGSESNVLWLGLEAEFRQTVKEALDKALIRAVEEFRSDAFAAKVDAAAQASTPTASPPPTASEGEASAR